MKLLLFFLPISISIAYPSPGLLRVPRVYNALVTSNQNLSPSRAFPVIQPVIHTTALGYVPPFYYTQFAPHFHQEPEIGRVQQELLPASDEKPEAEAPKNAENQAAATKSQDNPSETVDTEASDRNTKDDKNRDGDQFPLTFYPNYHSLYYDPYFNTYNGFGSHFAPNPYFFDYQPHRPLAPLPPQGAFPDHLLPGLPEQKPETGKVETQDKIPDVPPPPVPTGVPKKS